MFDGARPVYIDIGSIGKWNGKSWAAKQEFFTSYYYPLTFWSRGYIELALANLNLHWDVVRSNSYEHLSEIYNAIINPQAESGHLDRAENLENAINELKLEDSNFLWEGYQNDFWDRPLGKRFEREIEWIKSKPDIKSMTELGANQGYFSFQVAHMTSIEKIIATDLERTALDKCYIKLKEDEAAGSKITPLFMDFCTASEAMLNDMAGDCTVANALTHHLLLTDKMLIDALVERLFLVTKKYLIVEFMPRGMGFGTRVPKWYSLEWFMKHLSKKFEIETTEETEFGRIQIYAIKKTEVSNG
jgi:hypothetical protein